jgi:DNA polymerase III subunit delta'
MIEFFGSTASEDGWRIAIIDPLDELNRSGANALLKLVEEPPQRVLILMVTHAIGRLLPTIRSRCRVLHFRPLSPNDLISALLDQPTPPELRDAEAAVAGADGSVREALKRVDPARRSLIAKVTGLIAKFPELDRSELLNLTEGLNSRGSAPDYETVVETIRHQIEVECERRAREGAVRLAPLIEVWEKSREGMSVVDRYNLDRRPFLLSLFSDLADAQRLSVMD